MMMWILLWSLDSQTIIICLIALATPPGQVRLGGGAAYDSNKMGGVRTEGGAGGGLRVAGPGLSTGRDCQWRGGL